MNGVFHEVDVPVTNLDEEDDVIVDNLSSGVVLNTDEDLEQNEARSDIFQDGFETFGKNNGRVTRLVGVVSGWWNNVYKKNIKSESFELREYKHLNNNHNNEEDDDESEQLSTFPTPEPSRIPGGIFTFCILTFGFLALLITSSVSISNFKQNQIIKNIYNEKKPNFSNGTHEFYPTTIMISLDGFHPHYISPSLTPFMHQFYQNCYGPPYMTPTFPSSTFPNHWTIVTGLLTAYHGIVGNTFFDPQAEKQFINIKSEYSLDGEWWGGEPLWQTAYYQGVSAAVHMWPGSEVQLINGGSPLEFDKYNGSEVLSKKVNRILNWLDRDLETRPELMLSYVPTIDSLGHKYGVSGEKLENGLKYVDNFIESIVLGIQSRNLSSIVNFIIVSDHGMAPTSDNRLIIIDDLIDLNKIQHFDGWPLFGLRPFKQYSVKEIYDELLTKYETLKNPHFQLYLKEELPEEWKFGNISTKFSNRIAPIWLIPDVGYVIATKKEIEDNGGTYKTKGVHGYNNTELLMRAIFLAQGPYFENKLGGENKKIKPFQNTEIYDIVCDMLNIKPSPNNGTGSNKIVNEDQLLPDDWLDDLQYPNVDFKMDVMNHDSTYDRLFRNQKADDKVEIPVDPSDSLLSTEQEIGTSITPESVPGPTFKPDITTSPISSTSVSFTATASSVFSTTTAVKEMSWLDLLEDKFEGLIENIEQGAKDIFDHIGDDDKDGDDKKDDNNDK